LRHDSSLAHDIPGHPERPERIRALEEEMARRGWFGATLMEAPAVAREQLLAVHPESYVARIEEVCADGGGYLDPDTAAVPSTWEAAVRAAGGAVALVDALLGGSAPTGVSALRPPGHHAESERAMGFCIFNNIAVAAMDALDNGLDRVAIIDYDAHHGNGTQAAFLNEERVAFVSTHQWGIYPGTGWIDDAPHARKRIVDVPLPAFAGDHVYEQIADRIFLPFIQSFKPQMILISVGFDAHWNDPITSLGLSTAGYLMLAKKVMSLAEEVCDSRIVFVLEGGYDPVNVANGSEAVFIAATGRGESEANDPNPRKEPDCEARIEEVRRWHGF